jgi:molecular chaperone GrpE
MGFNVKSNMIKEKKMRKLYRVTQKVFLYDPSEKKFLLLRIADTETDFFEKYGPWDTAGGHVDEGDDIDASIEREISEEVGEAVRYRIDSVLGRVDVQFGSKDRLMVAILALYQGGSIKLSDEHTEFRWLTHEEIESDSEVKPWIRSFVKIASERLKEREYLNDLKRLQADFENYKKRQATREKEIGGYLIEKLVMDIVPVMDNFRMATEHVPETERTSPWVTGIQYIEKQLEKVLTENGVTTIEVKIGDAFDPTIHEALEQAVSDEASEKTGEENDIQTVTKVLQNGFRIGERVIRPAKVIVS